MISITDAQFSVTMSEPGQIDLQVYGRLSVKQATQLAYAIGYIVEYHRDQERRRAADQFDPTQPPPWLVATEAPPWVVEQFRAMSATAPDDEPGEDPDYAEA